MKKRMFTDDITSSGKFLRMSEGAQLLYFHMGLNADDDGVVDAFATMRMTNAKEDDLVLLVEREFIVMIEPKEMIVWISGWQDFNKIDPRIKEDSKYLPILLAKVEGVEIVQSTKDEANRRRYQSLKIARKLAREQVNKKHYEENKKSLQSKTNDPHGITPRSSGGTTDDLVPSIDKYSLVENSKELNTIVDEVPEMKALWKQYVDTTLRNHAENNLKAYQYLREELGEELPNFLTAVRMIRADEYQPRKLQGALINYCGLRDNLEKVEAYMQGKVDQKGINLNKVSQIPGRAR